MKAILAILTSAGLAVSAIAADSRPFETTIRKSTGGIVEETLKAVEIEFESERSVVELFYTPQRKAPLQNDWIQILCMMAKSRGGLYVRTRQITAFRWEVWFPNSAPPRSEAEFTFPQSGCGNFLPPQMR